jgi:hypothetical protein
MFMLHHSFTSYSFHVMFMVLFNPWLLYMQICTFLTRASAFPSPIAAPVITIQAMSKVHSPSFVICPTLQYHICPLPSPENVCIVCLCVKRLHPCICCRLEEGCYVPVSPARWWWRCGAWERTAVSLAPSCSSHLRCLVWLIEKYSGVA